MLRKYIHCVQIVIRKFSGHLLEAYLEPCQTSKMKRFVKVKGACLNKYIIYGLVITKSNGLS